MILAISAGANIIFIYVNIYPIIVSQFKRKFNSKLANHIGFETYKSLVVKSALEMLKSKTVLMPESERSFKEDIKSIIGKRRKHPYFYYPKAFLYSGITSIAGTESYKYILNDNLSYLNSFINEDGTPRFDITCPDQVPFGLAALDLYAITKAEKYKIFAGYIFKYIQDHFSNEGMLYRENISSQLNDILGMICPFLSAYGAEFNDKSALEMALQQFNIYYKKGVDHATGIPSHGYNLESEVKVGSSNWGRGIGWYLLALAELPNTPEIAEKSNFVYHTLKKLSLTSGGYSQYPGTSEAFDASTTVMVLYFIKKRGYPVNENDITTILASMTTKDGYLDNTSGDTYDLNVYSRTFGFSELSQGILLKLLSLFK